MRLFIADADSVFRLAVQIYLHREPGMYVTGMATESEGLSIQLEASRPDVVLLDWHLPGISMQGLLSDILALEYPPEIVVVSNNFRDKESALSAGASAFVDRRALPGDLVKVVRSLGATTDNR